MPVTPQEFESYRTFVASLAHEHGLFNIDPNTLLWHYTDGAGLLGILQSATIHATHVSALNDAKETQYATDLFKDAIRELIRERESEPDVGTFLSGVLEQIADQPTSPTMGTSKFFVTCFSSKEDDGGQWQKYAKGDGSYAIGFYPNGMNRDPHSWLHKVVYDRTEQLDAAKRLAEATVRFYQEGLVGDRLSDPKKWALEFYEAWDEWVYKLAPCAKDSQWDTERECRIIHELKLSEFPKVRFAQKKTMLSRYLPLDFPSWVKSRQPLLPIGKIIIGPGNHPAFTTVSVKLLLEQMGYNNVGVELTKSTLITR